MEALQVQRLREEQNRAIQTTNDQIDRWKKLNDEYKNLSDRLLTLPNKITHEVMVPFGPMAFMPGQLVHTNEILVLLGENWFVERSAKQASQIAKRRKKATDKQLEDLQLQKNLLVNRTSFTDEIQTHSEGSGDIKEINEKYDEEKEKEWKIQHRENIRKYHDELRKKKEENKGTVQKKQDDQSFWDRLDELERLEEERNELDDDYDDAAADSKLNLDSQSPSNAIQSPSQGEKRVRWFDEVEEEDSDDTESLGSESEDDVKGTGNRENLGVIHFTHSPVETPSTEPTEEAHKESRGQLIINSPTDIYKYFMKKSPTAPKSILKSPSFERELPQEYRPSLPPVKIEQKQKSTFQREKAFNEEVVEKVASLNITQAPEDPVPQQPKKMSKFKASRLQR